MRKSEIIILGIILLSFVLSLIFYDQMPERMAFHWNEKGEVDGYAPKLLGLFLMPIISVSLFLLFVAIPKIDPLKQNIEKFRKYYDWFVTLIIIFLFYLHTLSIVWNKGVEFNIILVLIPAFTILFYYCGILVENAKRNWFVGIRTPWTLSNENVWKKTHKIGGKLFKIAAIISLVGLIFQSYAIFFVIIPVITVAVYTIIYSYFEYQKECKA